MGKYKRHPRGFRPLPWYPLLYMQEYLDDLRALGHEPGRVSQARTYLARFGLYAQQAGIRDPEEVERHHVLAFRDWLATDAKKMDGSPLTPKHQAEIQQCVRRWFKWLYDNELISRQPYDRVPTMTVRSQARWRKLDPEDVRTIFEQHRRTAFTTTPFFYHRREALLGVCFGWGLNLGAICRLNVSNLDLSQDYFEARVQRGSSSYTRPIPFEPEMKEIISRYLAVRTRHALPTEDALFITTKGQRLEDGAIQEQLRLIGIAAGVNLSSMAMRDTYGSNLLEQGLGRRSVGDLMGIKTTMRRDLQADPQWQAKAEAVRKIGKDIAHMLGRDLPPPRYRRAE